MATAAPQTHCDRCHAQLRPSAAYCEECGERTRRARRLVRLAIRVELLFVLLATVLVVGFAWAFYVQKP